jgi:ABC-type antimicrobial peptide transport system permease subunit
MKIAERAMEIVGVVADIPPFLPGVPAEPEIYWPYQQSPRWASFFVLRTDGDPTAVVKAVEARLHGVDADLSPGRLATMEDLVGAQLKRPRFNMLLIGVFAALSIALTVVGVYGVVAASVAGRTREIGVRVALGASSRRVLGMVMREGMTLAGFGLLIGLVVAAGVSRLAAGLLYGVRPSDPLTYGGIALLLAALTALGCVVPAWRASRVDPMNALRVE